MTPRPRTVSLARTTALALFLCAILPQTHLYPPRGSAAVAGAAVVGSDSTCHDLRDDCAVWAAQAGGCDADDHNTRTSKQRARYMHAHCPKACGTCSDQIQKVTAEEASRIMDGSEMSDALRSFSSLSSSSSSGGSGGSSGDIHAAVDAIGMDLGVPQFFYGSDINSPENVDIARLVQEARDYVAETVLRENRYTKVRSLCKNKHRHCAMWATQGECDENEQFMRKHCAPLCKSCEELHVESLCPMDPNAKNALYPNDLNAMFERILTLPEFSEHVTVHVSPTLNATQDFQHESYDGPMPWVITIDNFITDKEAALLIEHGTRQGYERSTDVGDEQEDGSYGDHVSSGRTSTNSWCHGECEEDPKVVAIQERIRRLTGIPVENSEQFQLLRYYPGQFYETHHDYIQYHTERPVGPRILTVFMYLNEVEAGGGTNFPDLNNLTVMPKTGRVLIWPSVLNENPHAREDWTHHQALPVEKGIKYGANAWIHQRKFVADCA